MRELYAELRRRGRALPTIERAKIKLGHFTRLWGVDCPLESVDARMIARYIDTRLEDSYETSGFKTPKRITIRDELAFLRQALKLARRQGRYPYALDEVWPTFDVGHKPKRDWVTEENLPRLLDHVTAEHAAHLLFFVVTAGRLADSLRARREDFDVSKWRAHVRGSKTDGSTRTIPIEPFLRPLVRRMLRDAPGDDVLFAPWANISRSLREASARAGIPPVTTTGLRRTFGKWHRLRGYSLATISKLFGHTTEQLVRDVYADVDGDELAELTALERYKNGTRASKVTKKGRIKR